MPVINKRKPNPLCTKFKCNDTIITDSNDIAKRFNKFFVNIGASLATNIPVSDKRPSDYMSHDVMEIFYLTPVAEAEVDKIISNFRDSAAGWDELKPLIYKPALKFLLHILAIFLLIQDYSLWN